MKNDKSTKEDFYAQGMAICLFDRASETHETWHYMDDIYRLKQESDSLDCIYPNKAFPLRMAPIEAIKSLAHWKNGSHKDVKTVGWAS